MIKLNTKHLTLIYDDYLIDPSIINKLIEKTNKKEIKLNMIILINLIHIYLL